MLGGGPGVGVGAGADVVPEEPAQAAARRAAPKHHPVCSSREFLIELQPSIARLAHWQDPRPRVQPQWTRRDPAAAPFGGLGHQQRGDEPGTAQGSDRARAQAKEPVWEPPRRGFMFGGSLPSTDLLL